MLYAETYLNRWAGFVVRYTYWAAQVIAVGGEAVAAGTYISWWFPGVPVWALPYGYNMGQPIGACAPDRVIADVSSLLN